MKKRLLIGFILFVVSIILITTSNANFTVSMEINGKEKIEIGEEITYKVRLNETIIACNFDVEYDSNVLEFIKSDTVNLNAAVNGNVISCIYVDVSQQGTTEFKIKFKAIKECTEPTTIGITNVKFRAKNKETSYVSSNIQGVDEKLKIMTIAKKDDDKNLIDNKIIENDKDVILTKKDNNTLQNTKKGNKDITTATTKLPNTGIKETTGYLLLICSILLTLSAIFKAKESNLKKIFKAGGVMVVVITLMSSLGGNKAVYATNTEAEIKFYNNLVENENNALIIINEKNKKSMTKEEIMNLNKNITDITTETGESLNTTSYVKTKDIILIGKDKYIIIIYGDSSCDGIICDTDDLMTIVEHYIGKKILNNEQMIAANLENTDIILDTDDIMKMIDKYLGKSSTLVAKVPNNDINIDNIKSIITASNYGDYVDYNVDINLDGNSTNDWRIFYNDGDNIFLIASDVVKKPETFLNLGDKSEYWQFYNDYGLGFSSIAYPSHKHGYEGSSSINKDLADKFMLSWAKKYPSSTLWSAQITAFLMDNTVWNKFASGIDGAVAIGGPTIEMFVSSWNDKGYRPIRIEEIAELRISY